MIDALRDIWRAIEAEVMRKTVVREVEIARTDIVGHRVVRLPPGRMLTMADGSTVTVVPEA